MSATGTPTVWPAHGLTSGIEFQMRRVLTGQRLGTSHSLRSVDSHQMQGSGEPPTGALEPPSGLIPRSFGEYDPDTERAVRRVSEPISNELRSALPPSSE